MPKPIRRALAAVAARGVLDQLLRALPEAELELVYVARDGAAALEAVARLRPELVIADAQLPVLEGSALLERMLDTFRLGCRPAALLLCDPVFPLVNRARLVELGAAFAQKPLTPDALRESVEALRRAGPVYPRWAIERTEALMDELGVPGHIGRECLKLSALCAASDERCSGRLGARVYPSVGEALGLSAKQAERAMRHAIALAWQSDKYDNQYRIFEDTIDARRGQPTCGEMISRLADILRLEG